MVSSSERQPNREFTVIRLLDTYVACGQDVPAYFRGFLHKLLNLTILAGGQSLRLHYGYSSDDFTIAGSKRTHIAKQQKAGNLSSHSDSITVIFFLLFMIAS